MKKPSANAHNSGASEAKPRRGDGSSAGLPRRESVEGKTEMGTSVVTETKAEPPGPVAIAACPFCGSSNVRVWFYNKPSVVCEDCYAGGPSANALTEYDTTEAAGLEAKQRWNKRAGTKSVNPGGALPSAERARLGNNKLSDRQ